MPSQELEKYIAAAKEKNVSPEAIKAELIKHGWSEGEVNEALNPSTSVGLPLPPVPRFGMWVSFQYIILFICLYVSATSLGGILHRAVDKFIKDDITKTSLGYSSYFSDYLLKGYIAGIIVTFPIFSILFILLKKQLVEKPAVRNLRARKVLFYITLIGTFIIMIGHLISTIYGFLEGNTTLRSLAHLGVTLIVAGSIFIYLLNEVREDRKTQ